MPADVENTDDDALRWGGDDIQAPSLPPRRRAVESHPTADDGAAHDAAIGAPVVGPAVTGVEPGPVGVGIVDDDIDDGLAQMGNATLVGLGLLGGVYLLYTIGWVIGALRLQQRSATFIGDPMFVGAFWLAVLAPAAWFLTTLTLTRHRPTWLRIGVLVAGAVLLVPWPFLASGQVTL